MTFKWNPYPQIKPIRGTYLVTIFENDTNFICIDEYESNRNNEWWDTGDEYVTAWAELPEPYEKPVRLKAYPLKSLPSSGRVFFIRKDDDREIASGFIDNRNCIEGDSDFRFTHWAQIPEFDFVEE